jgi:hypothetical protein
MHFKFKDLCKCKQAHEYVTNAINQSSWACSPYLCASLVQEFWSSYFPQCHSLFVHVHVQSTTSPHRFHIFVPIFSSLSSIFIKGMPLLIQRVALRGRWLTLESCIFMDTTKCWNNIICSPWDTSCRIFWPWYQLVGHLPLCHSMGHPLDNLELLYVRELASLDDHLKLRITCGTTIWCARHHLYKYHL